MSELDTYIALFGTIIVIGVLFDKSRIPTPLILVMTGMLLSLVPGIPQAELNPSLVLNVFLPMIVYTASAEMSWREVRRNLRPILMMSVGHVLFIALLVASALHWLVPGPGWATAFIIGAIVSPPDDVAILAIAEKVSLPARVVTILTGESLLNDAIALTLFRFALLATVAQTFSLFHAVGQFSLVIVCECSYGLILGHLVGWLRLRIENTTLQTLFSLLTPFLAYLPALKAGGSGVLATAITGFVVGTRYLGYLSPESRLTAVAIWKTLSQSLQSLLFLLVGLNFNRIVTGFSIHQLFTLTFLSSIVILILVLGRFVWVYAAAAIPRMLLPSLRKKDPFPPWQLPFLISWAGMRGGISLAAAMAIPALPMFGELRLRDVCIFIVFMVIIATLLCQGLTLTGLTRWLGVDKFSQHEKFTEHMGELAAREYLASATLRWLKTCRKKTTDPAHLDLLKLQIRDYSMRVKQLKALLAQHDDEDSHDKLDESRPIAALMIEIDKVEREALFRIFRENRISQGVMIRLLQQMDHRIRHVAG